MTDMSLHDNLTPTVEMLTTDEARARVRKVFTRSRSTWAELQDAAREHECHCRACQRLNKALDALKELLRLLDEDPLTEGTEAPSWLIPD